MYADELKICFDEVPLEQASLEVRLFNMLKRNRVTTLAGALRIIESGLETARTLRGFGPKHFERLFYELEDAGFLLYGPLNNLSAPSNEKRLKWLAEQIQNSVFSINHIDFMIAAALSFIRQGHTSTQGEYAPAVAQAVRWLEVDRPLKDETMLYGLLCVLGENYGMDVPLASFEPPSIGDLTTLKQVQRYALLIGDVPIRPWEFKVYEDRPISWHSYHAVDLAWMTVGAPKLVSR